MLAKIIEIIGFFLKSKPKQNENPVKPPELVKVPSKKIKHVNDGNCGKCDDIFNKYPEFHEGLRTWFKEIQKNNPDAHISAAGRGKEEQELYFKQKTSNARYGQSAHNYGLAIDVFRLHMNGAEWPKQWFISVIEPILDTHNNSASSFKIKWYGKPGSPFYELPHFEIDGWRSMSQKKLVEPE